MLSTITKLTFISLVFVLIYDICLAENIRPLIIGRSATKIEHPIIIDPVEGKIFYSNIVLKNNARYELYLYEKEEEFIVVELDSELTTLVYRINIFDSKMPDPVFKRKAKGTGYFRRSAWSQEHQILCLTEFVGDNNKNRTRRLNLTVLNFNEKNVVKNEIDVSNFLRSDTGLWTISDRLIILGKKPNSTAEKEYLPDTAVVVNLKDMSITKKDFSSIEAMIIGRLGPNLLAASDDNALYSYDLNEFKKICDNPKGLVRIFGKSKDNKGCYAHVIKNRLFYEVHALEYFSFQSCSKGKNIFFGKSLPGDLRSCIFVDPQWGRFLNEYWKTSLRKP
jgi:hypothetical protein